MFSASPAPSQSSDKQLKTWTASQLHRLGSQLSRRKEKFCCLHANGILSLNLKRPRIDLVPCTATNTTLLVYVSFTSNSSQQVFMQKHYGFAVTWPSSNSMGANMSCPSSSVTSCSSPIFGITVYPFRINDIHRFLRLTGVRWSKWLDINDHDGPCLPTRFTSVSSSISVHGRFDTVGDKYCWYLSRHCLVDLPGIFEAIIFHALHPYSATNSISIASSCLVKYDRGVDFRSSGWCCAQLTNVLISTGLSFARIVWIEGGASIQRYALLFSKLRTCGLSLQKNTTGFFK